MAKTPLLRDLIIDQDISTRGKLDLDTYVQHYGNPIPAAAKVTAVMIFSLPWATGNLPWHLVFIPVILLLIIFLFRTGIVVNFRKNRYKKYWGPIPFKFGGWRTLGVAESVVMHDSKKRIGGAFMTSSMSVSHSTLNIALYLAVEHTDNLIRIAVLPRGDESEAFAKGIADMLDVPLEDERVPEVYR